MEMYSSAFSLDKLLTGDVTVTKDVPTRIGEYIVEAGEKVSLGLGSYSSLQDAVGRIYVDLKDDADANADGVVRFSVYSPQNRHIKTLKEFRTERLRQGATDFSKAFPLPKSDFNLTEDKKLVVEFIADANVTISATNSDGLFDVTLFTT